ncbi:MAG TPA: GtrA family protein [Kofleriaceae bacterium]|nr:GtrA family protein [Kofleriaceae bacterium]
MSGLIATSIDVGALVVLVEVLGSHVTLAAFLASTLGGVTNFLVNKYWAFRDRSPFELRQVSLYAFVSLITAAFVAATIHLLAVVMLVPYLWAKAIAAGLVFVVWTYPAQSKLVFPSAGAREPGADPADSLSLDDSLALE